MAVYFAVVGGQSEIQSRVGSGLSRLRRGGGVPPGRLRRIGQLRRDWFHPFAQQLWLPLLLHIQPSTDQHRLPGLQQSLVLCQLLRKYSSFNGAV